MSSFIERHQSKILTVVIVASATGLIWLDSHRHPMLAPGEQAPTFELRLLGDKQVVTSSTLRGEPAVLDFWATWCGPCRASLPHLNDLSKKYAGRVRFIAVNSQGEDEALQQEARDQLGLKFPIAVNGELAASLYHVEVLPTTVILDRDGRIAATFQGPASPNALAEAIDKVL